MCLVQDIDFHLDLSLCPHVRRLSESAHVSLVSRLVRTTLYAKNGEVLFVGKKDNKQRGQNQYLCLGKVVRRC